MTKPIVERLGRMGYEPAYGRQIEAHGRVLDSRDTAEPDPGRVLLVEHDPVITVTKRPDAASHVITPKETLERLGIEVCDTNRGGDVTYHGPGQLVCYPIIDLNAQGIRLHDYIRLLEQSVIDALSAHGIEGVRDPEATGVWVQTELGLAKVAAIGVRIRRWITLHGVSVNIDPDMSHFALIVPCGLAGRPVVSLKQLLGDRCPTLERFSDDLTDAFLQGLETRAAPRQ